MHLFGFEHVVNLVPDNYYQAWFLFKFTISSIVEEIVKKKPHRSDCEAHGASFKASLLFKQISLWKKNMNRSSILPHIAHWYLR